MVTESKILYPEEIIQLQNGDGGVFTDETIAKWSCKTADAVIAEEKKND